MARFHNRLWLTVLGGYAVASIAYLFVPPTAQAVVMGLLGMLSVFAVWYGVRVHRPAVRWPWYLMGLSHLLFTAGDLGFWPLVPIAAEPPFPSVAAGLSLASYLALSAAVLGLV